MAAEHVRSFPERRAKLLAYGCFDLLRCRHTCPGSNVKEATGAMTQSLLTFASPREGLRMAAHGDDGHGHRGGRPEASKEGTRDRCVCDGGAVATGAPAERGYCNASSRSVARATPRSSAWR